MNMINILYFFGEVFLKIFFWGRRNKGRGVLLLGVSLKNCNVDVLSFLYVNEKVFYILFLVKWYSFL